MNNAIVVKILPATNTKGARLKVCCGNLKPEMYSYPRKPAEAGFRYAVKNGLHGTWFGSTTKDGWVFVKPASSNKRVPILLIEGCDFYLPGCNTSNSNLTLYK